MQNGIDKMKKLIAYNGKIMAVEEVGNYFPPIGFYFVRDKYVIVQKDNIYFAMCICGKSGNGPSMNCIPYKSIESLMRTFSEMQCEELEAFVFETRKELFSWAAS